MCSHKRRFRITTLILTAALLLTAVMAAEISDEGKTGRWGTTTPLTNGLLEANSNRQMHPLSEKTVESQFGLDGFEKVGETNILVIYLNRAEGALRILNKNTGYLWGGVSIGEAEGLNSTWRCYGNGLVSIECFNEQGVESRVSIGKNGKAEYELLEDGLLCTATFEEYGISFQVKATWTEDSISLELVDDSLLEGINDSKYALKSMTFMPFLGSSYSDSVDGYILIPDGSGALIRFQQPANYSSTYSARVYGPDYGIDSLPSGTNSTTKLEAQVLMPIYGIVHGAYQNAFLAVVESGAEYTTLLTTPAQTNNPYNWAAARFEIRQKYVKRINRKAGAGASVPQEMPNDVTPKVTFYFLSGEQANYDGMAVMYRQLLIDRGVLEPIKAESASVPMQLEILGADKKNGFLWNTTSTFTTAKQAEEIIQGLAAVDISNLDVVYRCYTRNNECGAPFLSALGGEGDFRQFRLTTESLGGRVNFYIDPVTANADQITLRTEAANSLSKVEISWAEPMASTLYPFRYLYRLSEAEKRLNEVETREYGNSIALAQITSKLYSDHTSGKQLTRSESLNRVLAMTGALAGDGRLAMYQPNQYLWKYADKAFDMPASNSQILYESDSVPFLQIVLSGCVELYGSKINTSSYSAQRLLRHIEYGMAPAFIVTGCESMELYNTAQESYFSTNYKDWQTQINEAYHTISEGLGTVWGHSIISHKCIQIGLVRVEYDNGVSIYLNYTDGPLSAEGDTVGACSYTVIGG